MLAASCSETCPPHAGKAPRKSQEDSPTALILNFCKICLSSALPGPSRTAGNCPGTNPGKSVRSGRLHFLSRGAAPGPSQPPPDLCVRSPAPASRSREGTPSGADLRINASRLPMCMLLNRAPSAQSRTLSWKLLSARRCSEASKLPRPILPSQNQTPTDLSCQ